MTGWGRPLSRSFWIPIVLLVVFMGGPFYIICYLIAGWGTLLPMFIIGTVIGIFLGLVGGYYETASIWRHSSKWFDATLVGDRIAAGLEGADIGFLRDGRFPSIIHTTPAEEFMFLDDGNSIVIRGPGPALVSVGPVRRCNRAELDRLKRLIEGALAPPHHQEGI